VLVRVASNIGFAGSFLYFIERYLFLAGPDTLRRSEYLKLVIFSSREDAPALVEVPAEVTDALSEAAVHICPVQAVC